MTEGVELLQVKIFATHALILNNKIWFSILYFSKQFHSTEVYRKRPQHDNEKPDKLFLFQNILLSFEKFAKGGNGRSFFRQEGRYILENARRGAFSKVTRGHFCLILLGWKVEKFNLSSVATTGTRS